MLMLPWKQKKTPGFGYWGEYGEIDLGISSGLVETAGDMHDPKHYHKEGVTYFLVVRGEGVVEVEDKEFVLQQNSCVVVEPKEVYRMVRAKVVPFEFFVICTRNTKEDRVEVL